MAKPTVLLVGTDHFANMENGDLAQTNNDDVLQEKRQSEIRSLVDSLCAFRPTKVALEIDKQDNEKLNRNYQQFLQGNFSLTRHEQHQIGFRLAKQITLDNVHAVDWNEQPEHVPDVQQWSEEHDNEAFDTITEQVQKMKVQTENFHQKNTLNQYIKYLNAPNNIAKSHKLYMDMLLIGDQEKPAGAMWVAHYWYYRNMIIYKNIVELIETSNDRIFVLYGSGHSYLLQQFLTEGNQFLVEKIEDYI